MKIKTNVKAGATDFTLDASSKVTVSAESSVKVSLKVT
jgi:hypothetical protein